MPSQWRKGDVDQITEGGIKQAWKETRKVAREVPGFGLGQLVKWDRHSLTNYTHLRTNKGHLNQWRHKIKKAPSATCRFCGLAEETGDHITFQCAKVERPTIPTGHSGNGKGRGEEVGIGRGTGPGGGVEVRTWENWEDLEDRAWIQKDKNKDGKMALRT